mgnify:FL=1
MTIEQTLQNRSNQQCELCTSKDALSVYSLATATMQDSADNAVLICKTCHEQLTTPALMDTQHWQCINNSMWSTELPVQIMAWRILKCLSAESWAQDLLDMLYLDAETLEWAESQLLIKENNDTDDITVDNNGSQLIAGDTVTLIKDLDVKGAGFTAKRGTVVKNIALTNNPKHIEGRVNGVRIVLVADYLKKSM